MTVQYRAKDKTDIILLHQSGPDGWGIDVWFLIESAMLGYNIKEVFMGSKEHTSFEDYKEDISKLSRIYNN
jgi:hypothetical protein